MFGYKPKPRPPLIDSFNYEQELAAAPKRDVTREQFYKAALFAGWTLEGIDCFLKEPLYRDYVLVAGEGLRIV